MKKINIEMPVQYLIELATYGDLCSGKIPELVIRHIESEIVKNGFKKELNDAQEEKLKMLRASLKNLFGKDGMDKIDNVLGQCAEAMKNVKIEGK